MHRSWIAIAFLVAFAITGNVRAQDRTMEASVSVCSGEPDCRVEFNLMTSVVNEGTVRAGEGYRSYEACDAGGKGITQGRSTENMPKVIRWFCVPVPKR